MHTGYWLNNLDRFQITIKTIDLYITYLSYIQEIRRTSFLYSMDTYIDTHTHTHTHTYIYTYVHIMSILRWYTRKFIGGLVIVRQNFNVFYAGTLTVPNYRPGSELFNMTKRGHKESKLSITKISSFSLFQKQL